MKVEIMIIQRHTEIYTYNVARNMCIKKKKLADWVNKMDLSHIDSRQIADLIVFNATRIQRRLNHHLHN